MNDEQTLELYRSQLAAANEEKGMLYAQVKALTEEVSMLRQSMDQSKQAIDDLLSEIKSLCKKLEEKDKRIADLEQQLYDAHEQAKLGWKTLCMYFWTGLVTDNDQDLLQDQILDVESMGKFEEFHSGRKGPVE